MNGSPEMGSTAQSDLQIIWSVFVVAM